jgi:hypothetical protein
MSIKHSGASFLFKNLPLIFHYTHLQLNPILVFEIDCKIIRAVIIGILNKGNAVFQLLLIQGEKDGMKRQDVYFPTLCVVPIACINELQIGRNVANVSGASGTPVKLLMSFDSAS